eukprot:3110154-Rhodomonas_salina.1
MKSVFEKRARERETERGAQNAQRPPSFSVLALFGPLDGGTLVCDLSWAPYKSWDRTGQVPREQEEIEDPAEKERESESESQRASEPARQDEQDKSSQYATALSLLPQPLAREASMAWKATSLTMAFILSVIFAVEVLFFLFHSSICEWRLHSALTSMDLGVHDWRREGIKVLLFADAHILGYRRRLSIDVAWSDWGLMKAVAAARYTHQPELEVLALAPQFSLALLRSLLLSLMCPLAPPLPASFLLTGNCSLSLPCRC